MDNKSNDVTTNETFITSLTALKHLCWQVPNMMYRIIFAELFPHKSYMSKRLYTYHDLRKKIDNQKDSHMCTEKRRMFSDLTHVVGWNDDMEYITEQLLEQYELQPISKQFELDNNNIELIFAFNDLLTDEEFATIRKVVDVWRCFNERLK